MTKPTPHWAIPVHFNIAQDVCDKWAQATPDAVALIYQDPDGTPHRYTFRDLQRLSCQAAALFESQGVQHGDRIAVLLPQCPQTAITHLGAYRLGAIAVPLFTLFGDDALLHRLADSGAKLLVTDAAGAERVNAIRARLPDLATVLVVEHGDPARDFDRLVAAMPTGFATRNTLAETPALIIYTSGTTGKAKGALHAHRTLLGHLPGVELSHGGRIAASDVFWTPADWAWIGGLLDVLLPAWHFGATVVACRFAKFDVVDTFDLMHRYGVNRVFLPPTALRLMRSATQRDPTLRARLESVASGGESLGAELQAWARDVLGVTINEFYGQTECNMVVSSCAALFETKPGFMGRPVPGHDVRIIDDHGIEVPPGTHGHIAVRTPDPVMFLHYWNNPEATAAKFLNGWLLTGDLGFQDTERYIKFVGRDDDVITSAGYRIGPGPIEDCLASHPAVKLAAVIGTPDETRTEIVKAFVVLEDGIEPDAELTRQLQDHVRTKVGAHEYPRAVEYLDALPMTSTGKIMRAKLRDRPVQGLPNAR
ncbi:AMP-dependent synthetase [Bordetella genomosp. 8]|uniref:AMP-dependent synthetase n=1 Tax=Bordetella genomosp. 8 TaxID=1416806 RepID=A0A1W6YRE2_9BORD|nr:AMP-binding protein [Bordetella genomosp. 8]ARP83163.1 AMP-dependent synthetase [Bordetella genomosp. 8]